MESRRREAHAQILNLSAALERPADASPQPTGNGTISSETEHVAKAGSIEHWNPLQRASWECLLSVDPNIQKG